MCVKVPTGGDQVIATGVSRRRTLQHLQNRGVLFVGAVHHVVLADGLDAQQSQRQTGRITFDRIFVRFQSRRVVTTNKLTFDQQSWPTFIPNARLDFFGRQFLCFFVLAAQEQRSRRCVFGSTNLRSAHQKCDAHDYLNHGPR